ncbi:hypothetical protein ABFS82_11G084100 [Erythranthe guttata]
MGGRRCIAVSALLVLTAMGFSCADRLNKSAADDYLLVEEDTHLDGGFSSLDGMLQWAIGHSDPAKLKETTLNVQRLSPEELKQRQMEIKELEKLQMPSDAKLMTVAINDLNNLSLSLEDRRRALQELLVLVEPIENANDLHKLGGLTAVIKELNNPNPEIRIISAWILGKASQNNPFVQNQVLLLYQILELGVLAKLMEMAHSDFVEEATKSLYAISALIRNYPEGQDLFYMEAGDLMLQKILSNSSIDIRLHRKCVFLLSDLVEFQLDGTSNRELPFLRNQHLLKSVIGLLLSPDLDLQEKALYAVKNLLMLRSSDALVFKDVCELDLALSRMRQQLQQLILEDKFNDYAIDVENLRREVELIFRGKLDMTQVIPALT